MGQEICREVSDYDMRSFTSNVCFNVLQNGSVGKRQFGDREIGLSGTADQRSTYIVLGTLLITHASEANHANHTCRIRIRWRVALRYGTLWLTSQSQQAAD